MMGQTQLFPENVRWAQVRDSIIENKIAVYGYSPRPDSVSIGIHAVWDWTDEAFVAHAREVRLQYRSELEELHRIAQQMYQNGADDETVARFISSSRNKERMLVYTEEPEAMNRLLANNQNRYGTAQGISADAAYRKYGSWKMVIEKSLSINLGMDVCCGLCHVDFF